MNVGANLVYPCLVRGVRPQRKNVVSACCSYLKKVQQMKRIVNIARSFKEAEEWDIKQQISMTPDERLQISRILRERVYGKNCVDVREWHRKK